MWGVSIKVGLVVLVFSGAGGCSREPRGDARGSDVGIRLVWFFANGGSCGDNRVAEVQLRGNAIGSDAIAMRAPCGDGSLRFPPPGTTVAPGGFVFEAMALDAIGISCFETITTTYTLEDDDEDARRLIFHKNQDDGRDVCRDIGADIDGGVPEPEPDAGPDSGAPDAGEQSCGCFQDGQCMSGYWDSACGADGEPCRVCAGRCEPDKPGCAGILYRLGFCGPAGDGIVGGTCYLGGDPVPHCCNDGLACDPLDGCVFP